MRIWHRKEEMLLLNRRKWQSVNSHCFLKSIPIPLPSDSLQYRYSVVSLHYPPVKWNLIMGLTFFVTFFTSLMRKCDRPALWVEWSYNFPTFTRYGTYLKRSQRCDVSQQCYDRNEFDISWNPNREHHPPTSPTSLRLIDTDTKVI